jgi:DNA-binding response OmpR family regulator
MARFGWYGLEAIPAELDLRRCGWNLIAAEAVPAAGNGELPAPVLLTDVTAAMRMHTRTERAAMVLVGVDDGITRAHWLALGFGDVLPGGLALAELDQRIHRVAHALAALPRQRGHGQLRLDLLAREGHVGERRLVLHPREFALLWRLAEAPGEPVAPEALLSQVWQLNFRPETNSLAVHICRLRAKLAVAGLPQIIRTTPEGAYVLAAGPAGPERDCVAAHDRGQVAADEQIRLVAPTARQHAKV